MRKEAAEVIVQIIVSIITSVLVTLWVLNHQNGRSPSAQSVRSVVAMETAIGTMTDLSRNDNAENNLC